MKVIIRLFSSKVDSVVRDNSSWLAGNSCFHLDFRSRVWFLLMSSRRQNHGEFTNLEVTMCQLQKCENQCWGVATKLSQVLLFGREYMLRSHNDIVWISAKCEWSCRCEIGFTHGAKWLSQVRWWGRSLRKGSRNCENEIVPCAKWLSQPRKWNCSLRKVAIATAKMKLLTAQRVSQVRKWVCSLRKVAIATAMTKLLMAQRDDSWWQGCCVGR